MGFPQKVIIDTDPGIDDCMALLMCLEAHYRGQIEVVAITLVKGNAQMEHHVSNIKTILGLISPEMRAKIPVYIGCSESLLEHPGSQLEECGYHGRDGFNDILAEADRQEDPDKCPVLIAEEPASVAMYTLARKFPGQIKILAIGPLTNIALASKLDGDFIKNIEHFYVMGGNMEAQGNHTRCAEFNFYADAEAAHVFFRKLPFPVKATLITWELCDKHTNISWDWRMNVLGKSEDPRAVLMNRLEQPYLDTKYFGEQWVACDQLAAAVLLQPECVLSSKLFHAQVECGGHWTRGQVVLEKRKSTAYPELPPNVEIVELMDVDILKTWMLRSFGFNV